MMIPVLLELSVRVLYVERVPVRKQLQNKDCVVLVAV